MTTVYIHISAIGADGSGMAMVRAGKPGMTRLMPCLMAKAGSRRGKDTSSAFPSIEKGGDEVVVNVA